MEVPSKWLQLQQPSVLQAQLRDLIELNKNNAPTEVIEEKLNVFVGDLLKSQSYEVNCESNDRMLYNTLLYKFFANSSMS
jgi:hypothetical protein